MSSVITHIENSFKKPEVPDIKSGDTVRVHQKIREGNKERVQIFEGVVIRTDRKRSHTASMTVRRVTSGVGVEKTYLLHSPLIVKIDVAKRSKVRRNYLSYLRDRAGKSARLTERNLDLKMISSPMKSTAPSAEAKTPEKTDQAAK